MLQIIPLLYNSYISPGIYHWRIEIFQSNLTKRLTHEKNKNLHTGYILIKFTQTSSARKLIQSYQKCQSKTMQHLFT